MILLYTFVSVFVVSLISLIGVLTLTVKQDYLKKILLYFVAFSVGGLIGDTFLHLLPQSFSSGLSSLAIGISLFAGVLSFFILEKILRWRHCHDIGCHDHPAHLGTMNLIGDAAHNAIDGILIGASFVVSIPLGIATTLAVIFHEIPHELGNFGVLLHSGFTIKKALFFNYLSSLVAIVFAILAVFLGRYSGGFINFMVPFTAGSFLYIAMSDLIPELHKEEGAKKTIIQTLAIILGIATMALMLLME
ncbi:MAG: ZIP family metal transporter [Candidatus Berkelbacteria bacterium]